MCQGLILRSPSSTQMKHRVDAASTSSFELWSSIQAARATHGMNNIAAVLIFHSDEVFAFDLMIKLLNDYHLKEVTMNSLYGLHMNCDVLSALVKVELPRLGEHFKKTGVSPFQFSHNWIFTLFSQNIPLGQI